MTRSRPLINYPMLLKVIGWLLMIESGFMLIPLLTCVIYGETADGWAFFITFLMTLVSGALMTFCIHPSTSMMAKREGFLLTALVWVVFSLFGMVPFLISTVRLNVSEAFFEAVSGFTTTGATVYASVESLSHGVQLWRCLMQWIGGMGIILFTLAVLPMLNCSSGMQMFNAEVTGITHDKIRPRISQTAKGLWAVYFILTGLLTIGLWIGPMDFFDSICHAFSSISTGGASTRDDSIGGWDGVYIKVLLSVFMFLGGVNFALIFRAGHGDWKSLLHNEVFVSYIRIILGAYLLFTIAIVINGQADSISAVTIDPIFQVVSIATSTGLTVTNFEGWGAFVLAIVFFLMFFGGCAGSTSGGAKIDRLLILLKNTRNELFRSLHPNTILGVRISGRVMSPVIVSKVIAFLCLYVMVVTAGAIVLTAMGIPLVDSFFSAFSCVSNTGLGAGVTGYGGSYDIIPSAGKWVLAFLMIIGRLELFTVLVIFTPGFWKR